MNHRRNNRGVKGCCSKRVLQNDDEGMPFPYTTYPFKSFRAEVHDVCAVERVRSGDFRARSELDLRHQIAERVGPSNQ